MTDVDVLRRLAKVGVLLAVVVGMFSTLAALAAFGGDAEAYFALWQTIDAMTLGTWIASTGWLLLADRPLLGRFLVVLGLGGWAFAALTMLGVHSLAVLGTALLVALVVWLGWVSLGRARRPAGRQAT